MAKRNNGDVRRIKRNGRVHWVVDFFWFDRSGRQHRYRRDARVQTRDGALVEARALQERAWREGTLSERPAVPTVREFVEGLFRSTRMPTFRPATRTRYEALLRQGLLAHFGGLRLDELGPHNVHAYAAKLAERGVQAKGPVVLLRTIARAALDLGLIDAMPTIPRVWKDSRKLPDAPPREEVERLIASATKWLRTAIALAAFAGLRSGEVRAIEVGDVDLAPGRIVVRHAMSDRVITTPKSGHERIVPIAPALRPILEDALRGKLPKARLLTTAHGTTPPRQHVLIRLNALEDRLGMKRWTFHQLRHHFCTSLLQGGAHLETVRVLAGHSSVTMTQRYVHATSGELERAIARI